MSWSDMLEEEAAHCLLEDVSIEQKLWRIKTLANNENVMWKLKLLLRNIISGEIIN
jgi:hypothetical protein